MSPRGNNYTNSKDFCSAKVCPLIHTKYLSEGRGQRQQNQQPPVLSDWSSLVCSGKCKGGTNERNK